MVLGEIESAISIFEKVRAWFGKNRRGEESTVATRFVRLFEAHGVHRNQIPRVFGRGLTLSTVIDDVHLLESLTGQMLEHAAELFAVRRAWLEGASDQIYPLHDFYKKPREAEAFLDSIRARTTDARGVVLIGNPTKHEESALIILEEAVGAIDDDKTLYRYHLCNNWLFPYWKSRAFLAACVAAAWRKDIHLLGRKVPIETIRAYKEGKALLHYEFDSALPTDGTQWHPEDMLVKPECFLDGLDEGAFARAHGLDLWLSLETAGFLKTDLPYVGTRERFQEARAIAQQDE